MEEERPEEQPWQDPIVAEVRRIREALFAEAGYDVHEFFRRLRERQATSGHTVVSRGSGSTQGSSGEAA
jgi:hypothetical protein